MKTWAYVLGMIVISLISLSAATGPNQQNQAQMKNADCSKLSPSEQNFAAKLTDMNNKSIFCSQFSPQQRQQAMQMMGTPNSSGDLMSGDDAVQQVMQMGGTPAIQPQKRTGGGCPVK